MSTTAKSRKNPKNKVKLYHSLPDRILTASVWVLLIIIMIVILVPLMFILASSFSDPSAVSSGKVFLWPVDFSLVGYKAIFQSPSILRGFINSVEYTLVGTIISVTLTLFAGYPLSRVDLKIRGPVMFLFTVTMFFSGGMIPTYLVVSKLHLIDTFWAMVFPLSKPIIAVMVLLYAVGKWNDFFSGLIYLNDSAKQPLQMTLRNILVMSDSFGINMNLAEQMNRQELKTLLQYSLIVVSSVPVLLLYPLIQKHFVKGIMMGSIKG